MASSNCTYGIHTPTDLHLVNYSLCPYCLRLLGTKYNFQTQPCLWLSSSKSFLVPLTDWSNNILSKLSDFVKLLICCDFLLLHPQHHTLLLSCDSYCVNLWFAETVPGLSGCKMYFQCAYLHLWSRGWAGYGRCPSSPAAVSAGPCCFPWPGSAGLPVLWWPRSDSPPGSGDSPSPASASPALHGAAPPFLTSSAPGGWGTGGKVRKSLLWKMKKLLMIVIPSGHPELLDRVLFSQIIWIEYCFLLRYWPTCEPTAYVICNF